MQYIDAGQEGVTASGADREPTAEELAAIQREMPVIEAEIELLDAEIATLGRVRSHLDARRLRRAERRLLGERRRLAAKQRTAADEVARMSTTTTAEARRYPLPRPTSGEDPRFTFGMFMDVAEVLERHGYPPITTGRDLLELQMALFRYLYAAESADAVGGGAA